MSPVIGKIISRGELLFILCLVIVSFKPNGVCRLTLHLNNVISGLYINGISSTDVDTRSIKPFGIQDSK